MPKTVVSGEIRTSSGIVLPSGYVPLTRSRVLHPVPIPEPAAQGAAMARAWQSPDGMGVIAGIEPTNRHGTRLHVSVSFAHRLPTWSEMKTVKDAFFGPDRDAMIVLPRERHYVNVHKHCHHLWEIPEDWDTS